MQCLAYFLSTKCLAFSTNHIVKRTSTGHPTEVYVTDRNDNRPIDDNDDDYYLDYHDDYDDVTTMMFMVVNDELS